MVLKVWVKRVKKKARLSALAFLADFTPSDFTAPIRTYCFLSQITLYLLFGSKDKVTAFTCLPSYR